MTVHYRIAEGTLGRTGVDRFIALDPHGKRLAGLIEDSWDSEAPVTFVVGAGEVLDGIDEGVVGMRIAEERVLDLPPDLGFGDRGDGALVSPGASLLVFLYVVSVGSVAAAE